VSGAGQMGAVGEEMMMAARTNVMIQPPACHGVSLLWLVSSRQRVGLSDLLVPCSLAEGSS